MNGPSASSSQLPYVPLEVQKTALGFGMSLKDCSAYNVQFKAGKPVFIDTLSFEHYVEGDPWVAFRQFCQHYLAPLVLMSFKDIRLNQLFRIYIDGIPLISPAPYFPSAHRYHYRFSLSSMFTPGLKSILPGRW